MSLVWEHYFAHSAEKLLALKLADVANDEGRSIFTKVESLSRATCMSVRSVQGLLRSMEASGFLVVTKHAQGGRGHAREYSVNPRWLAKPWSALDGSLKSDDPAAAPETLSPIKGADSAPFVDDKGCNLRQERVQRTAPFSEASYIRNPSLPIPLTPNTIEPHKSGFDRWWDQYPKHRRVAKARCRRMWERKGLDASVDQVLEVLTADCASPQWRKDDGQFIPLPMTWLNQDRFERDVEASPSAARVCCECGERALFRVGGRELCKSHFAAATGG